LTFYAIRHVKTDKLFPEVKTRGGYSHWNPDNSKMPNIFKDVPRLFKTRKTAQKCIIEWFACQNGRRMLMQSNDGEYDDIVNTKEDGRKKEDLEVVEVMVSVITYRTVNND
jgi:hypothetical protein